MMKIKEKLCFFGDYNPFYPREYVLKKGLELNNIKIEECQLKKSFLGIKKLLFIFYTYPYLFIKFTKLSKNFTFILVPHANLFYIPLAKLLAKIYKKHLICPYI